MIKEFTTRRYRDKPAFAYIITFIISNFDQLAIGWLQQRMAIKITRGLDIPLKGEAEQKIYDGPSVTSVALFGIDYVGLKPSMLITEGDRVKLGQPIFTDRKNPGFNITLSSR